MDYILRWSLLGALLLPGCAHKYVYSGMVEAKDSGGKTCQHVLYWNRTERPLWFNTAEGASVRILAQCSLSKLAYDERPNGIVFRARDRDKKVIGAVEPKIEERICGKVVDANRIVDLPEDKVHVTVLCEDAPPDDLNQSQPYLEAQEQAYEFTISKREVPDYSDQEIPKPPKLDKP